MRVDLQFKNGEEVVATQTIGATTFARHMIALVRQDPFLRTSPQPSVTGWEEGTWRPRQIAYKKLLGSDLDIPERRFSMSPDFEILRGSWTTLFVGRFTFPDGSYDWEFFQFDKGLQYIPVGPDDLRGTRFDWRTGTITHVMHGVKFKVSHPVWPWPLIEPDEVNRLAQVMRILTPGKKNPLTQLLRSPQQKVRTMAEEHLKELKMVEQQLVQDVLRDLCK